MRVKIHFIGIGGIGVSALAQYCLSKNHKVSGSDLVSSEITDFLKKSGAEIFIGPHSTKNLAEGTGLVIYSPAVKSDNPEFKEAQKLGIKIQSYPQALGDLTKKYFTIAVSGTHGKSTTTAMIALVLIKAGFNPTVILGTKLKEFGNSNFHLGGIPNSKATLRGVPHSVRSSQIPDSKILVIEADEWQASFLNYWPKIIVLTNIEKEHLDYYKDLNHILKTYKEYLSHLPKDGVLVVNGDDKNISKIKNQKSKFQIKIQNFSIKQKETKILKKILKIPGEHNIYNALAALTAARILNILDKVSLKALSGYKGAWRRYGVIKGEIDNKKITIISDYAHHPTEVRVTLEAVRQKFSNQKIWCVFQPHQYQRTHYLFDEFVNTFRQVQDNHFTDKMIVTDIYDVAGREKKKTKTEVSSRKLVEKVKKSDVIYLPKEKIINYLKNNLKVGDILIIMGAGDIYKLIGKF